MGLFDKLKNILFEEDEEEYISEIPVFDKDSVKKHEKVVEKKEVKEESLPVLKTNDTVSKDIKLNESGHFKNVKRDIDLSFSDDDVLSDIPGSEDVLETPKRENRYEKINMEVKLPTQEKSVFQTFDEEEFERINSHHNVNRDNKVRREIPKPPSSQSKRVNSNVSPTKINKELEQKVNKATNLDVHFNGKKPFQPSPVISPVYGILDKNYTKDEIVDKKDGMKREKVNIVKNVKLKSEEVLPDINVDIDSVRNKAFGELEDLEEAYLNKRREKKDVELPSLTEEVPIEQNNYDIDDVKSTLDDDIVIDDLVKEHFETEEKIEDVVEQKPRRTEKTKPKELDELEKTSTLQILDDIEKELNSIKPVQEEIKEEKKDDTMENELFDLIDSMYESGEEESDD